MIYPWLHEHWLFFLKRLQQDRLAHALMIEGPAGSGKNDLAIEMVGRLLCSEDQLEACGQCRSCKLLAGGAHPDRFELYPEEGSEIIKVDQVRNLIASLDLTTSISERKVAYIHPADGMNIAASNALLKSLEEPTGNAVMILVSSDPGSLPVTIRSRCQSIVVCQPDRKLVLDWLTETTGRSVADVSAALQAAGGSPLRAAQYLESPELDTFVQVTEGLATLLKRPGSVSLVCSKLSDFNPDDLWRWLSLCAGEAVKCLMTDRGSDWLPAEGNLSEHTLLKLQKQADTNRRLAKTPVRGDLLLQDWLIRWAEQNVRNTQYQSRMT